MCQRAETNDEQNAAQCLPCLFLQFPASAAQGRVVCQSLGLYTSCCYLCVAVFCVLLSSKLLTSSEQQSIDVLMVSGGRCLIIYRHITASEIDSSAPTKIPNADSVIVTIARERRARSCHWRNCTETIFKSAGRSRTMGNSFRPFLSY